MPIFIEKAKKIPQGSGANKRKPFIGLSNQKPFFRKMKKTSIGGTLMENSIPAI